MNTLLDTISNNSANPDIVKEYSYIFEDYETRVDRLKREKGEPFAKYVNRLENCGNKVVALQCKDCGNVHYGKITCNLRTCPTCAKDRSNYLFFRTLERLQKLRGFRLRMIEFSYGYDMGIRQGVKIAKRALYKIWRNRLKLPGAGLLYTVELGRKNKSVHLHCLYYGPFISVWELRKEWERLTGKWYVDIRLVRGKRGIREVLKYVSKGVGDFSYEEGFEIEMAFKGIRRVDTYGVFRGIEKPMPLVCPHCGCNQWRYLSILPMSLEIIRQREIFKFLWHARESGFT